MQLIQNHGVGVRDVELCRPRSDWTSEYECVQGKGMGGTYHLEANENNPRWRTGT